MGEVKQYGRFAAAQAAQKSTRRVSCCSLVFAATQAFQKDLPLPCQCLSQFAAAPAAAGHFVKSRKNGYIRRK